jgi:hypothetical protein
MLKDVKADDLCMHTGGSKHASPLPGVGAHTNPRQ